MLLGTPTKNAWDQRPKTTRTHSTDDENSPIEPDLTEPLAPDVGVVKPHGFPPPPPSLLPCCFPLALCSLTLCPPLLPFPQKETNTTKWQWK